MRKNLNSNEITNFLFDITYKIMPKKFKKYKMLTLSGVNTLSKDIYTIKLKNKMYNKQIINFRNIILLFFKNIFEL